MVNEFQPCMPENVQEDTLGKDMNLYKCPACGTSKWLSEDTLEFQCSCGHTSTILPSSLLAESVLEKNKETYLYNVFELPEKVEFDLDYLPKN